MELRASCFWCGGAHPAPHALSVCPPCVAGFQARRFPLGPLEMSGSFPLDAATIDDAVSRRSPGNYALGYLDGETFLVFYVGRSDSDVKSRLHEWVGAPSECRVRAGAAQAAWGTRPRRSHPVSMPALARVATGADSGYTRFAYSYAASADAAFQKECQNYDDFGAGGGLDNATRPARTAA